MKAATITDLRQHSTAAFQSTPPVKAATCCTSQPVAVVDISIHAAREGGDFVVGKRNISPARISIHAAREGGDAFLNSLPVIIDISIHAAREGGDAASGRRLAANLISIHAAREGGDAAVRR